MSMLIIKPLFTDKNFKRWADEVAWGNLTRCTDSDLRVVALNCRYFGLCNVCSILKIFECSLSSEYLIVKLGWWSEYQIIFSLNIVNIVSGSISESSFVSTIIGNLIHTNMVLNISIQTFNKYSKIQQYLRV